MLEKIVMTVGIGIFAVFFWLNMNNVPILASMPWIKPILFVLAVGVLAYNVRRDFKAVEKPKVSD